MLHNVSDAWLNDHGIDRDIADAHGLGEYRKSDVRAVQDAYRALPQWQQHSAHDPGPRHADWTGRWRGPRRRSSRQCWPQASP
jgi:hypothetical protein